MQLDLYHVFYVSALELNFSKAAKSLYITQPSVSYAIKQLEEKLQVKLFLRTSKGVILTKEGDILLSYLTRVFELISNAEQEISQLINFKSGHVTIGGSDSTCKHFLLPKIQTFQDIYPEIKIKLQHGSTPQIMEKLQNGLIDIGVIHLPIDNSEMTTTDYLNINSVFVVGEKYKELANKIASLEEISSYPMISFSTTSSSRRFLNQLFERQGLHVKPDIEVGSVELLIECAKIGMGIAFVTKELVLKELAEGELFEVQVSGEIEQRKIGLITKKEMPLSIAANKFFTHLLENNLKK